MKLTTRHLWLLPLLLPALLLGPLLVRGELVYGYDTVGELAPWYGWAWTEIAAGHFPHWNPHFLAGMPMHAAGVVSLLYPPSLVHLVLEVERAIDLLFLAHLGLAGIALVAWLRAIGLRIESAVFAGIVLSGSEALVSRVPAGELPQLAVVAWIPVLLWWTEVAIAKRSSSRLALTALPAAMMLLAGHLQYVVYGGMLWSAYLAHRLASQETRGARRRLAFAAVGVWLLAGVLAAPQLLPTLDYIPRSHRGAGLAPSASSALALAPWNLTRFIAPTLFGNELRGLYWGESVGLQNPLYLGLAPLALAILGALRRSPHRACLVATSVFGLLYAMGPATPVWALTNMMLPPLTSFRIPARMLVVTAIPIAALAGLGLERLLAREQPTSRRHWLTWVAVGSALLWPAMLSASSLPASWTAFVTASLARGRALTNRDVSDLGFLQETWQIAEHALSTTATLALAGCAVAVLLLRTPRSRWAVIALFSFTLVDLGLAARRQILPAGDADLSALVASLPDERPLRVMTLVPHDAEPVPSSLLVSYGIAEQIGEFFANQLSLDGIDGVTGEIGLIPARTTIFTGSTGGFRIDRVEPASRLDLLAEIALTAKSAPSPFEASEALELEVPGLAAHRNLRFTERALISHAPYPITAVDPARRLDDAVLALWQGPGGTARPRTKLVLEVAPGSDVPTAVAHAAEASTSQATDGEWAVVVDRTATRVLVTANLATDGWLVLLEPWDPHWRAFETRTERELAVLPAQVLFRAVPLTAGRHEIRFQYQPRPYHLGLALLFVLGLPTVLLLLARTRRAERSNGPRHA